MSTPTSLWYSVPAPRVAAGREPLYIEFEENWLAELNPQGPAETDAAQDFIRSAWRKREVIEEQNKLDVSFATTGPHARTFDRLMRYEREFESRCGRALSRLRKLQADRAKAEKAAEPHKPQSIRDTLPEDLVQSMYIMDIETRHLNAHLRARKAVRTDPDVPSVLRHECILGPRTADTP